MNSNITYTPEGTVELDNASSRQNQTALKDIRWSDAGSPDVHERMLKTQNISKGTKTRIVENYGPLESKNRVTPLDQ